jgi:diguanylate cyclase (GGDEF)-like protein
MPWIFLGIAFTARVVVTTLAPEKKELSNLSAGGFNAAFFLSTLVCSVLFNASLAGLTISRLISKIHQLSIEDSLTKLANRRHIEHLIESELEVSRREHKTFSIVMLDVDHFKSINDKYGHAAGDAALQLCASVIRGAVRGSDHIGRIGGEEFVALLPDTDEKGALLTAERMRSYLERETLLWDGNQISITASFGVVTYGSMTTTSSDLFKLADSAMYQAKSQGRNRVINAMAA